MKSSKYCHLQMHLFSLENSPTGTQMHTSVCHVALLGNQQICLQKLVPRFSFSLPYKFH